MGGGECEKAQIWIHTPDLNIQDAQHVQHGGVRGHEPPEFLSSLCHVKVKK